MKACSNRILKQDLSGNTIYGFRKDLTNEKKLKKIKRTLRIYLGWQLPTSTNPKNTEELSLRKTSEKAFLCSVLAALGGTSTNQTLMQSLVITNI